MMRPPSVTDTLLICMHVSLIDRVRKGYGYGARIGMEAYKDAGAWKKTFMDWVTPTPLVSRRIPSATRGKEAQLAV